MARETASDKAARYLAEGRVCITHARPGTSVRGWCRGDGAVHRFGWDGSWWCQCPHRGPGCSHLVAARLITAPETMETTP